MTEIVIPAEPLPVGSKGWLASGQLGMVALIATEATLFAYLLFSYFYLALHAVGRWPPTGPPALGIAVPGTAILVAASLVMWWGERGIRRGSTRQLMAGLILAMILGIAFVGLQGLEWSEAPFRLSTGVYSSLYFTITGFHLLHVVVGLLVLGSLLLWTSLGYFGSHRHSAPTIGAIYWHFVTVVWLVLFFTFYIVPRLG